MNLVEVDRKIIWHPFTQEKTADPVILIEKGKGSYLYDNNGKAYLDLVSSWWVNIHGHANEEIARAIYEQSMTLEHVIFAGFTHKPAIEICQRLNSILPDPLKKFFFSDNGSTAVEVGLKMCYQHYINRGVNNKTKFLCFDGAYHGDTVGSMSVSIGSGYHDKFQKLCFPVISVPFPETWFGDEQVGKKEDESISVLTEHLTSGGADSIVAIIIEPLIQGASGMRMCRPQFVKRTVDLVRQYDVRVIFDEIFVGFGRTGTYFALEQTECVPDVICLSKGLTGGFLPLALTVTTDEIYESFLSDDADKTFYHGHSYTANPLGCSAAIASLKLLTNPSTQQSLKDINESHSTHLFKLQNDHSDIIEHARIIGTVAAFNLKDGTKVKNFKQNCLKNGILLRPLGRTFYLLPPYCTTKDELDKVYATIAEIVNSF